MSTKKLELFETLKLSQKFLLYYLYLPMFAQITSYGSEACSIFTLKFLSPNFILIDLVNEKKVKYLTKLSKALLETAFNKESLASLVAKVIKPVVVIASNYC